MKTLKDRILSAEFGTKNRSTLYQLAGQIETAIRDTLWMARRYQDGRKSYAPSVYESAVKDLKAIFGDDIEEMDPVLDSDAERFTSKEISIELHKLGFYLPSVHYYEWTGAERIQKLTSPGWLEDSINVYSENEMRNALPKNVAVNENVVEFRIKPEDNEATKIAKVIAYLMRTGAMQFSL